MTDSEYEEIKIRMQKASYCRGLITNAKLAVKKYTNYESSAKGYSNRKEWANKKLLYWIEKLKNLRKIYSQL